MRSRSATDDGRCLACPTVTDKTVSYKSSSSKTAIPLVSYKSISSSGTWITRKAGFASEINFYHLAVEPVFLSDILLPDFMVPANSNPSYGPKNTPSQTHARLCHTRRYLPAVGRTITSSNTSRAEFQLGWRIVRSHVADGGMSRSKTTVLAIDRRQPTGASASVIHSKRSSDKYLNTDAVPIG